MHKILMEDIKLNTNRRIDRSNERSKVGTVRPKSFEIPKLEKSINNLTRKEKIEIEENRRKLEERKREAISYNRNFSKERIGRTPRLKKNSKTIHGFTIIIFILCILGGGIYWGGEFLYKANIEIKQKQQDISYDKKIFSAVKDTSSGLINFEIMMISDKKIKSLTLKDTKEVSEKAKGVVKFYNIYSATPQKLLAGSFVSDDDGKTYKLDKSITIPGYTLDKDKKVVPGSVSAPLTSFLSGEIYNGSPDGFYINSFKDTDKYRKIYGKIESSFEGGAQGVVYVLNDENKQSLKESIESSFKSDLINQVRAQIPAEYILYPDASNFSYKVNEDVMSSKAEAKIEVEGFLSVVILNKKSLIDNIIKTSLPNITSKDEIKEIRLEDLEKLSFSFVPNDLLITKDLEKIDFSLNGNLKAIWDPDLETLRNKLKGVDKNNVSSVFKQDPGVSSAVVNIFPLWKKVIPVESSKIIISNDLTK